MPGYGGIVLCWSLILGAALLVVLPPQVQCCSVQWKDPNLCYPNVYTINGVYCFNNGSGICKVFAGRFEFYYDTFNDKILGPTPKSEYVDQFGYHQRVPVSYNITGDIIYADRSINWARVWAPKQGKSISLLSSNSFNWCRLAVNNWWPYKSSVLDPTKRYHIYFYNRQSCVFDSQNPDTENAFQHFNTRFIHNTSLRIDLDMNPTIFAMEDNYADDNNRIRLVKHHRQHWYEVEFEVLKDPTPELSYFVKMNDTQTEPCKLDGHRGPLITKSALNEFNGGRCVDERYTTTRNGKNSLLYPIDCGLDQVEISDLPYPLVSVPNINGSVLLEVRLHNLPRRPPATTEYFYGVEVGDDREWEEFAKDGFVFSATTTIPIDETKVRVIMLFADFKKTTPQTYSDEHYPLPMIADYESKLVLENSVPSAKWEFDRASTAKVVKTLNYVDDIAYLHQCKTILVILGPLYSEVTVDLYNNLNTGSTVGSIYDLGIFELTNSFFAMPDSNTLWVFHRTNYITDHTYTCGSGRNGIVTATKKSGKYYARHGNSQPSFIHDFTPITSDHFEETFFTDMGVFKGSNESPEAPDPAKYPLGNEDISEPVKPKDNTWIYVLVVAAILLVLAMCIICMFAMRARKRRRQMMSKLGAEPTTRSSFFDSILAPFDSTATRRSIFKSRPNSSSKIGPRLTTRTSLHSKPSSATGSTATKRSTMTHGRNSRSLRGPGSSSSITRRSGVTKVISASKERSNPSVSGTRRSGSNRHLSSRSSPRPSSTSSLNKTNRSGPTLHTS